VPDRLGWSSVVADRWRLAVRPFLGFAEMGPGDLSLALGYRDMPRDPYPPEMQEARERVFRACRGGGLAFLETCSPGNVAARLDEGVRVVAGHREEAALGLEPIDLLRLLVGEHLGPDPVPPRQLGGALPQPFSIPGDEHEVVTLGGEPTGEGGPDPGGGTGNQRGRHNLQASLVLRYPPDPLAR